MSGTTTRNRIFDVLLGDYGALIGIPDLVFDDSNRVTLGFDGIVITMEAVDEVAGLVLTSEIDVPTDTSFEDLRARLLQGAVQLFRTGHGFVGLDFVMEAMVWTNRVTVGGLAASVLHRQIQEAILSIGLWQDFIHGRQPEAAGADEIDALSNTFIRV